MSALATPFEDRYPIFTYVGAYEEGQVRAAVRRELLREGQVFYVHNRVEDIDAVASRLAETVPEARVAVAHGQMGESRLERVIDDFWRKEIDVLVCTTIVETGLDVTDANTLIVDRADRMGLSQSASWSDGGINGCRKFLDRVWKLQEITNSSEEMTKSLEKSIHKTIKKVSEDFESLKFNTAIAALMTLINEFYSAKEISREDLRVFLILLNPVSPHITEEIWQEMNFGGYIFEQTWPKYDEAKTIDDEVEMPIQINGKVRTKIGRAHV